MTCWIHPDAETELGDAAVYYAEQASLAIAEAFLAEYERVRDLIEETERRVRSRPASKRRFRPSHRGNLEV